MSTRSDDVPSDLNAPTSAVYANEKLPFDVWYEIFMKLDRIYDRETLLSAACTARGAMHIAATAVLYRRVEISDWRHVTSFAQCTATNWIRHLSLAFSIEDNKEWLLHGLVPVYNLLAHGHEAVQPKLRSLRITSGLLFSIYWLHSQFSQPKGPNGSTKETSEGEELKYSSHLLRQLAALKVLRKLEIIYEDRYIDVPRFLSPEENSSTLEHFCETYSSTLTTVHLENIPFGSEDLVTIVYKALGHRLVNFRVVLGGHPLNLRLHRQNFRDTLRLRAGVRLPRLKDLQLNELNRLYLPEEPGTGSIEDENPKSLRDICPHLEMLSWVFPVNNGVMLTVSKDDTEPGRKSLLERMIDQLEHYRANRMDRRMAVAEGSV